MAIINITTGVTGLVDVTPTIIFIDTNDTNAVVTTAGYLTHLVEEGYIFTNRQLAEVHTSDLGINWYQVNVAAGPVISLVAAVPPGGVVLPTVVNYIAKFTNAGGTIGDAVGPAINQGNIQAGIAGTQGSLVAFGAANAGVADILTISYVTSGANRGLTITNAAMGQATTLTISDPGVAASGFILKDNAGTQTIATGSLALTVGNFTATAGNVQAGSSGHAGIVTSFPAAAANGSLILAAVANVGNFTSTISSVTALGQATVYTLPDPANAVARFLVAATAAPFTANHSLVASGTGGLIADAGYQMKTVAQAAVAGGAAAQVVVDAFCTAASMVTATWNDTTNAVTIQKVAAGVGQFTVTSSADPGASHLNYIITKV